MAPKWFIKLREHFHEVIATKTSPHSIGIGFAIGTFISILPTPGLNLILGLVVILLFKKVNKFSLFSGILFWNPLTAIPIYFLSYNIGDFLFGNSPLMVYELAYFNNIYIYARRFLVGNLLLALTASIGSYYILRVIFTLHYRKNEKNG